MWRRKSNEFGTICRDFSAGYMAASRGDRVPPRASVSWRNGYDKYFETVPMKFRSDAKRRMSMHGTR